MPSHRAPLSVLVVLRKVCFPVMLWVFSGLVTAEFAGTPPDGGIAIKGLVIFGDSLSDNVNTWRLSHFYMGLPDPLGDDYHSNDFRKFFEGFFPKAVATIGPGVVPFPAFPAKPYERGYFSNGPVAVEFLADYAGLDRSDPSQYRNLAFGASWTTSLTDTVQQSLEKKKLPGLRLLFQGKVLPPSFSHVADTFLRLNPVLDPDTMYAVYFSGNDYLNGFSNPMVVVARQFDSIRNLINGGARHIFWGLVPDSAMAPCFHKGPHRDIVSQWGREHNSYVRRLAQGVREAWPQVKLTLGDIGHIFQTIAHDPANGFVIDRPCTNVYIPGCDHNAGMVSIFNTGSADVCEDPDHFLFWDQVHATTRVHRLAAGYVCQLLAEQGYRLDCPSLESLRQLPSVQGGTGVLQAGPGTVAGCPNSRPSGSDADLRLESQPGA